MMKAIYAGTFDPFTNGHLDILLRALKIFSEIVVAVSNSPSKNTMFSLDERVSLIYQSVQHLPQVKVVGFSELLIDFMVKERANILIRGLRTTIDFEYELGLHSMYRKFTVDVESVFFPASDEYAFVSSSIVKEIAIHGGDVTALVPSYVANALTERVIIFASKIF